MGRYRGMFYQKPLPFIWRIRCPVFFDREWEQERDLRLCSPIIPEEPRKFRNWWSGECDRMEYDGSMMFDDYPDKFMMRRICRRIEEQLEEKGKSGGSSGGEELEGADRRSSLRRDVPAPVPQEKLPRIFLNFRLPDFYVNRLQ